eukprot:jgi/Mesen1/1514/ME000132S00459
MAYKGTSSCALKGLRGILRLSRSAEFPSVSTKSFISSKISPTSQTVVGSDILKHLRDWSGFAGHIRQALTSAPLLDRQLVPGCRLEHTSATGSVPERGSTLSARADLISHAFPSPPPPQEARLPAHEVAPSWARSDGTAPRFFKAASAAPAPEGGGYVVKLDNRVLKTPAKKPLKVPSHDLAMAIAAEWEWQEGKALRPFTMPLMKLASTAIDQIPVDRPRVIATLLKYFHTDSILCHAPPGSPLSEKQERMWGPILQWAQRELLGLSAPLLATSSLLPPDQSEEAVAHMRQVLSSSDDWELAAIDSLAGSARSVILGLAVAKGRLPIGDAVCLIRLEEDHQVEDWGFVEGGHDIDIADLRVRVAAPSVFLRLLRTSS